MNSSVKWKLAAVVLVGTAITVGGVLFVTRNYSGQGRGI